MYRYHDFRIKTLIGTIVSDCIFSKNLHSIKLQLFFIYLHKRCINTKYLSRKGQNVATIETSVMFCRSSAAFELLMFFRYLCVKRSKGTGSPHGPTLPHLAKINCCTRSRIYCSTFGQMRSTTPA